MKGKEIHLFYLLKMVRKTLFRTTSIAMENTAVRFLYSREREIELSCRYSMGK